MEYKKVKFIRYPGGKQRILKHILPHIPSNKLIAGKYAESFVGGGSVFFALSPKYAILSDVNKELMDLYRGIKCDPLLVWEIYQNFPSTKAAYYEIRSANYHKMDITFKAARTLYLNRTCFKGMWRHNSNGDFNVGYGGQDRRWVINKENLFEVSKKLKNATLRCCDFEEVIDSCLRQDFIFVDPPYRPGEYEMNHSHYFHGKFSYVDQKRLSKALERASSRRVRWALTNSSHPHILSLYRGYKVKSLPKGTGKKPGLLINNSNEVLIYNY